MSDRPLTQERQRCFECGISYPPDAPECEIDHARLWPDTIHHVWRIEGVIAARPGGATCAAYHLHTGERVAIDVVRVLHAGDAGAGHLSSEGRRIEPSTDDGAVRLLQAEAQALHTLDQANLLRLFESGVDEQGIAYLVTELGTARPLGDLLEEWQRSGHTPVSGRVASQIGRQLLTALVAAHRAGLAHQGLQTHHVFLLNDEEVLAGRARAGAVRLRGLRALSLGQTIRGSIRADLRGVAALLYELVVGDMPSNDRTPLRDRTIPSGLDPALWEVIVRGLGDSGRDSFSSADEMLRALAVAVPPIATEVSAAALASLGRTDPGAAHSSTEEIPVEQAEAAAREAPGQASAPALVSRLSGPLATLPAPPEAFAVEPPPRSSISGELQAVSFRDLFESEQGPRRVETLAQSRRRVSAASLKIPALPAPPEFVLSTSVSAPNSHPGIPALGTSGEHASLEPTADLSALPIADFASQSSGRINAPSDSDRDRRAIPHASAQRSAAPMPEAVAPSPGVASAAAIPEPIDPYAATGQVTADMAKPKLAEPHRASGVSAGERASSPKTVPVVSSSRLERLADPRSTGSAGAAPAAEVKARQSGERPGIRATSSELDAIHDRRYAWAIAFAAAVVLVALWLLVH